MNHFFNAILLALSVLITNSVYAAFCKPQSGFSTVPVYFNVGEIPVSPSDELYKVLLKKKFPINGTSEYDCTYTPQLEYLSQYFKMHLPRRFSTDIYHTNIKGLGFRAYHEKAIPRVYYPSASLDIARYYEFPLFTNLKEVTVEFIKIAETVETGPLEATTYISLYPIGANNTPFFRGQIRAGDAWIKSTTCEITDGKERTIRLDDVSKRAFKGIGTTLAEKQFNIAIQCNGGFSSKNPIGITMDFEVNGTENSLIANTAAKAEAATGVSLKLTQQFNNEDAAVVNGQKIPLGNLGQGEVKTINLPFKVAYYQNDSVKSGLVQGRATLTFQYD